MSDRDGCPIVEPHQDMKESSLPLHAFPGVLDLRSRLSLKSFETPLGSGANGTGMFPFH